MRNSILGLLCLLALPAWADKVVLLQDAIKSSQARADFITTAKNEITAQYFTIDNDHASLVTLSLLKDAAKRGVQVRLIVDSMNNFITRETVAALVSSLEPEKAKFFQIRVYNRFNLFRPFCYTKRMHDKGLIIDGNTMISGGRNIANGYFQLLNRNESGKLLPVFEDTDILVTESDSIQMAKKYFYDLWNSNMVSPIELYEFSAKSLNQISCSDRDNFHGCQQNREFNVKRVQEEENKFTEVLEQFHNNTLGLARAGASINWQSKSIEIGKIQFLHDEIETNLCKENKAENNIASQLYDVIRKKAQVSVTIVTPYLVVTPEQKELFQTLIDRNVHVRIITNSRSSNDVPFAQAGAELTVPEIVAMGVDVLEFRGPDTLHAKMVLIDRKIVFIGSFNWDFRSQNLNREVGVVFELPADNKNEFTYDLMQKFNLIVKKTNILRLDNKKIKLAELTDEEIDELTLQNEHRASKNDTHKSIIKMFPSIIKQF
ncbi:MAG: phosphatidylserine/phosphatidylglycerophosphate/cardiolipin synthase family protein [Bdellovibrio sp.]|nr:phosphatidylserine/phosphatidylglycerophosphate/cardiolipin synthase family protein [Bdellovibrio sp.]